MKKNRREKSAAVTPSMRQGVKEAIFILEGHGWVVISKTLNAKGISTLHLAKKREVPEKWVPAPAVNDDPDLGDNPPVKAKEPVSVGHQIIEHVASELAHETEPTSPPAEENSWKKELAGRREVYRMVQKDDTLSPAEKLHWGFKAAAGEIKHAPTQDEIAAERRRIQNGEPPAENPM